MNKIEANISLFAITFFASIQYVFLAGVPADLSHFAFMCITNLIGFLMTFAFFFGELFRLDVKQIIQSSILSLELIGFNFFMLIGVKNLDPSVVAAVISSYFVFILIFESVIKRKWPEKFSIISVFAVLAGLFLMINANIKSLLNINILYLIISNVFFAVYVMSVGSYASSSNPSILAMGQMFFCFIFALILWIFEAVFTDIKLNIPTNREFWVGVIYISFFIRGIYGIIQVYAQRYVSPLNTSLIFSSEIVMTMLVSPIISKMFGTAAEPVTLLKIIGSILIVFGIICIEPGFLKKISSILSRGINFSRPNKNIAQKITAGKEFFVITLVTLIYVAVNIPVLMTGFLPDYAGIKNAVPFVAGLFFGFSGVTGCCAGAVFSSFIMVEPIIEILWECWCVTVVGLCMYYGWHHLSKTHRIRFKQVEHYSRYIILVLIASILCFKPSYIVSYFLTGLIIGLPINILFGSLLYVEPFLPAWCEMKYDAEFELDNKPENLERVNEILEETANASKIDLKRILETQSCLEELAIRIFNALPDTKIKVNIIYYNAISMRLDYVGIKYNPFKINKHEDVLDIMSLKIIKHRALRASFFYVEGKNKVHVVI